MAKIFKENERDQIRQVALDAAFETNQQKEISYTTETLIEVAVEAAINKMEKLLA